MATGSDVQDFNGAAENQATGLDEAIPTTKKRPTINADVNTEYSSSTAEAHDSNDHLTTVHPHDISEYTLIEHQHGGMPTSTPYYRFQEQCELTVPMDCPTSFHNESIQDREINLSKQELVVSAEGALVLTNIKQVIEEKSNEIHLLKIQIRNLQDEAELKEEQYQVEIDKKNQEITSLMEQLADKDRELQEARDEAEGLKLSNNEREKELLDKLKQTEDKHMKELLTMKEAKEVECLKLKLDHLQETKKLELEIKELECQLAKKETKISDLEKIQLKQQLEETERESKRKLENQKRVITDLQEKLLKHSGTGGQRPQLTTSIASNGHNINITSANREELQPIIAGTANLTLAPPIPDLGSNTQTLDLILKNGSSLTKKK